MTVLLKSNCAARCRVSGLKGSPEWKEYASLRTHANVGCRCRGSLLVRTRVFELTVERASWAMEAERAKAKHDPLAIPIHLVKVAVSTRNGRLGVQSSPSLMDLVETGELRTSTMNARTAQALDMMSQPRSLVEGLTCAHGEERLGVANLVEVKLSPVRSVLPVALSKSKGLVVTLYVACRTVFLSSRLVVGWVRLLEGLPAEDSLVLLKS